MQVKDSRGTISMKQLRVGDKVKVDDSTQFETVYGFGHRSETLKALFLQLHHTSDMDKPLEISQDHMVFVMDSNARKAVPASIVKIGDSVFMSNGQAALVTRS